MSATISFADQLNSKGIFHIDEADRHDQFICTACNEDMIVVKSSARKKDWHFRHTVESQCLGGKDGALHNFAVQILKLNEY